jgi:hypothetical protein
VVFSRRTGFSSEPDVVGELERDVLTREVRHGGRGLVRIHRSYRPFVEDVVAPVPAVVQVVQERQTGTPDVGVEGRHLTRAVGLVEHVSVLLHKHDHVLDGGDGTGAAVGRDRGRAGDARQQQGRGHARARTGP